MSKSKFSIIIVPHDIKKTRTFRVPYALFYTLAALSAMGLIIMILFSVHYGTLLIKTRELSIFQYQVVELSKRQEQMTKLQRNLAELRAMNVQVRRMLGLGVTRADSLAMVRSAQKREGAPRAIDQEQAAMLRAIPTFWPVRGFITKKFDPAGSEGDAALHGGIDIAIDRGTPVRAAAAGDVTEAGWDNAYGYYVQIDHGYGIKTLYAHAEMLVVVRGERVGQGQTIAYSGTTGKSSAPHLHFQVTQNNVPVDPLKYLLQ